MRTKKELMDRISMLVGSLPAPNRYHHDRIDAKVHALFWTLEKDQSSASPRTEEKI